MATIELLEAFADAWNRHDIDALMAFMTDDCVFQSNVGSDAVGTLFRGTSEVRDGFARAWQLYPDARWSDAQHFISGDRGASEWMFTGTTRDGAKAEVAGCDLFLFREGKIAVKNSFRKQQG